MLQFSQEKYAEGERAFARGLPLNLIIEQAQRDHTDSIEAEAETAGLLLGYAGAALQCLYRVEGLLANLTVPAVPADSGVRA